MNKANKTSKTPDRLKSVECASLKTMKLDNIVSNSHRIVSAQEIPPGGIAGIIYNDFLFDGYHRLQWLKDQGLNEAVFIVLE